MGIPMYFVNDKFLPHDEANIHVTDLGLLRGYGIFDFFRVVNGESIFLEDHLDRFFNSAAQLHLTVPHERPKLREAIAEIARLNAAPLLGVKLILTGGYSTDGYEPAAEPNLIMIAKPFALHNKPDGLTLMTHHFQRELPTIKSLNYLTPISQLVRQKSVGADDILYHFNNRVSESSRSNIFIFKNETLITPKDHILFGITRKHILHAAKSIFKVEERAITLEELYDADEVFLSASTKRVAPVSRIDDHRFNPAGVCSAKLLEALMSEEKNND